MAKSKLTMKEKKAIKQVLSSKKIMIALLSLILIIGIAFGVLYFAFPDTFWGMFGGNPSDPDITNPEGHLKVHFLDVGQGDCAIVQLPDGKNMIIDAGNYLGKGNHEDKPEDVILNTINDLKITEFEHMILTHSDADHVKYMEIILNNYLVKNIYRPAFRGENEPKTADNSKYAIVISGMYDDFITAVANEVAVSGAKVHFNIGDFDITGTGYHIDMQCVEEVHYLTSEVGDKPSSEEKNFVSPFTVLRYGNIDERIIVFTGDAEGKDKSGGNGGEGYYLNTYRPNYDADVLKAGHHGSATSSSQELLDAIDPEYVVVSAGVENNHDHPRPETVDRLADYTDAKPDGDADGITGYSTRDHGDITLSINTEGVMTWNTVLDITKPLTPAPQSSHSEINPNTHIAILNSVRDQYGMCA